MLGAAIGKSNRVASSGGITVAVLVGRESSLGVVILNSVSVFVYSWSIISWFMVWSGFVGWGMVSWSMYYWLVDYWSWVVNWGWGMISWSMYWSSMINWSMYWSGMINWSSVVWSSFVDWNMSRSMDSSAVFFSSIWVMYVLWGSMGLA